MGDEAIQDRLIARDIVVRMREERDREEARRQTNMDVRPHRR